MKDFNNFPVKELVEKLESLKQQNRDLLTVENIALLDEFARRLQEPKDDTLNGEMLLRITLWLLKWITESDDFDIF